MHRPLQILAFAAVAAFSGSGCATSTEKIDDKKNEQKLVQDAPLGSRIRKKSSIPPVSGATRDDIERQRVQQGAIETGIQQN